MSNLPANSAASQVSADLEDSEGANAGKAAGKENGV